MEGDKGITHTHQRGGSFHSRFPPQLAKHGNEIKFTPNKERGADDNLIF